MAIRLCWLIVASLLAAASSGCALWHNLQPHRMHRLNRTPPPHLDPEFSQVDFDGDFFFAANHEPAAPAIIRAQNPKSSHE